MPTYEVRRHTVVTTSVVTAANETEARCLARDIWQQDAAIASLSASVQRQPVVDFTRDAESEARYEEADTDRDTEERERHRKGLQGVLSDAEGRNRGDLYRSRGSRVRRPVRFQGLD